MLCIQEELAQLNEIAGSPEQLITDLRELQLSNSNHHNSASNSNDTGIKCTPGSESIDSQRSSWVEGILGCMRPVWTMLSKAAINEKIKGHSSKSCKFLDLHHHHHHHHQHFFLVPSDRLKNNIANFCKFKEYEE